MQAIKIASLTKKFDDLTAVDSLTLSVDEGEIFGLVGPDGAGNYFFVLRAENAGTGTVTLKNSDLGWSSNPTLTITALRPCGPLDLALKLSRCTNTLVQAGPMGAMTYSPDGTVLASESTSGGLRLWRVADGALLRPDGGGKQKKCG